MTLIKNMNSFGKITVALVITTILTACSIQSDAIVAVKESAPTSPMLWSEDHKAVISLAKSLLIEPEIQAAKDLVTSVYEKSPSAQIADGKARMNSAIDELVFGAMLTTASENFAKPTVAWSEALGYSVNGFDVPNSRYAGDTPDRMYRNVVVSPDHRYQLNGKRDMAASLDFSIEVIPSPANWGIPPLAIVQAKKIKYDADGSFVITMDASPANGRPNHLQLPPKTKALLIRDTIADWQKHKPVPFTMVGLDATNTPNRTQQEIVQFSADTIKQAAHFSLQFFAGIWERELNQLTTYVRDLGWGIIGLNRFSIADDEALIVTIDPLSAEYFGLQVDDLWLRSIDYTKHISTLNTTQTTANADGSYTFVVATTDPGYANWLDTGGLNDGYLVGRWELFEQATNGEGAVREVRKVKFVELAAIMPKNLKRVSVEERQTMLQTRKASYELRLLDESAPL